MLVCSVRPFQNASNIKFGAIVPEKIVKLRTAEREIIEALSKSPADSALLKKLSETKAALDEALKDKIAELTRRSDKHPFNRSLAAERKWYERALNERIWQ